MGLSLVIRARPSRSLVLLVLGVAAGLLGAAPRAGAVIMTFASFNISSNNSAFEFINSGSNPRLFQTTGGGSIALDAFSYTGIVGLPAGLTGNQVAHMTMTSSTTTPAIAFLGQDFQPINGVTTITITRDTPFSGQNLLLMAVISSGGSDPLLSGSNNGNSATFSASTPAGTGQTVTFTSDFLNFSGTIDRSASMNFSSVNPALAIGAGNFLRTFATSGQGSFGSDPLPLSNNAVPEPASCVLAGIGMLGILSVARIRRRETQPSLA